MPDPATVSTMFGYAAAFLAGLAVLAVLLFVIVWAALGIRRELVRARTMTKVPPFDPTSRYWREHSHATVVDGVPLAADMVPPPAP
jgi:hypothetical protein